MKLDFSEVKFDEKLFTVVVPTLGRKTLPLTLDSINKELCNVIVVADTFEMDKDTYSFIEHICYYKGAMFTEVNAGKHDWGSPQLQYGYELATGQFILNCGDDDVFEPYAFETMHLRINLYAQKPEIYWDYSKLNPMMFRTVLHPSPVRGNIVPVVLWHLPALINKNITGQCFVVSNIKEKLGSWNKLQDYGFICETVENFGGNVEWCEEVISQCY